VRSTFPIESKKRISTGLETASFFTLAVNGTILQNRLAGPIHPAFNAEKVRIGFL
jgi:hypothetical protein